ncbi:MAG: UDP-N-acetylmuramate dehydrogenase [Cyclobacteriaceae bacterium]
MLIHQNISLLPYNTFQIDVNALYMAEVRSIDDLDEVYTKKEFGPLPKLVLGGGSNVLFTGPQRKVVIKMGITGMEFVGEDANHVWVKVGAGEIWHQFVLWAIDQGLSGVENLSLIPGTVGAAPMQNIGAYGVEIKEVFDSLEAYNVKSGKLHEFTNSDCKFGYRHSVFKGELKNKFIITSVVFKLYKKPRFKLDYGAIRKTLDEMGYNEVSTRAISEAVIKIRQSKLPDPAVIGNAGSFFKNPIIEMDLFDAIKEIHPEVPSFPVSTDWIKVPAAWLIDKCGWKGKRRGDIGVHDKQALVLVNHGGGNGRELIKLSDMIVRSVQSRFGIELSREVNVV